jgi:hypothetical protein
MRKHWAPTVAGLVAVFMLALPPAAPAQQQPPRSITPHAEGTPAGDAVPRQGGPSLARIRRLLRETPPAQASGKLSLLKLEYYIQVVGTAPRVDFFKEFKIGPATAVQYGGMTHSEFLRMVAPPWRKWQH